MAIELGMTGEATMVVTSADTALSHGTGVVDVLSTPKLLELMQKATMDALRDQLNPGEITAGLRVNLDHLVASPIGATVVASTTLTRIEGRRLIFDAEAVSNGRVVGVGRIIRVRLIRERFLDGIA